MVFIKNYLKTALRNISKNKTFSLINIIGLAISMSVGLVMLTFVHEVESYDEFHLKSDRVFRINNTNQYLDEDPSFFASTSILAGKKVQEEVDGIEALTIIRRNFNADMQLGDQTIPLQGFYATPGFFEIFTFPLLSGDATTALKGVNKVVLTSSSVEKLFGDKDPLGQILVDNEISFTVTGVVDDPPFNSHMDFEMIASFETIDERNKDNTYWMRWNNMWMNHVYMLLDKGVNPEDLAEAFNKISSVENAKNEHTKIDISLQSLTNISPGPDLSNQLGKNIESNTLWMMTGLAFIVIISACFNYTNLSIARSLRRSKEVGVRKVVGASSRQVFAQFIVESILISLFSLVLSIGIFFLIKPYFLNMDDFINKMVTLDLSPVLLFYFVLLALITGILAGLLPAGLFSRFSPQKVLSNSASTKLFKGQNMRKVLIVAQFTLSLMFILAATLEYRQYQHALSFDLGYDTSNILNVRLQGNDAEQFRTELEKIPEVEMLSSSLMITSVGSYYGETVKYKDPMDSVNVYYNGVDDDYITLHDHKLIAGNNFAPSLDDSASIQVIVNEETLKRFSIGTPEEAIGEPLKFGGDEATIVGVINNFHYGTIQSEVDPFLFRYRTDDFYQVNIKFNTTDLLSAREKVESAWKSIDPIHPIRASFYDDRIEETYSEYAVMIKIIGFLAFLAITIAIMGLLGMVMFTTETRMKEISIRKVLGATEQGLVMLLGRGFMWLLLIASLLAIPSTYYLFDEIVFSDISYRAPIGVIDLLAGTVFVMIVAIIAVSSQTIGASRQNPAQILRNE